MHGTKVRSKEFASGSLNRLPIDDWRSIWSFVGPIVDISESFRKELDDFSRFAIYSPQTAVMRGLAVDNRVVEPLGLTGSGLASAFERALGHRPSPAMRGLLSVIWSPGWADQIRVGDFDSLIVPSQVKGEGRILYIRDKYMRGGRNYLSPFDASEGTLYLIFVAALLAHPETPDTFALDNVDGTLNPKLVRTLTSHIVNACTSAEGALAKQVFMTSHHPSALDSFDIFNDEQKIFIASRRDGEDSTQKQEASGSTHFRQFKPPKGMDKDAWVATHGARKLSELLLTARIRDAL